MSVVIDVSITIAWYFKDEATPVSDAVLEHVVERGAFAPPLWRIEVVNALKMGVKRKRIDLTFRAAALAALKVLPVTIDPDGDRYVWTRTLDMSDRYDLTVYDACYLELADRYGLPLATFDQELQMAGKARGLSIIGV